MANTIQEFNGGVVIDGQVELLALTQNEIDAITTDSNKTAIATDGSGHIWQINGEARTDLTKQTQNAQTDITGLQNDVAQLERNWQGLIDKTYPVGAMYLSTAATSPASLFGGSWTQITSDAYLKIVTSNAGTTAGTNAEHKIPISSLPAHTHNLTKLIGGQGGINADGVTIQRGYQGEPATNLADHVPDNYQIGSTGGSQAYYPYFYGVFVWQRTA